jgi:hypothetical protein
MLEVAREAVLAAPASRIFPLLSSAERNVEWVPDLAVSERLTPGPTRVGSRFRFVLRFAGIPLESIDEVVEIDPPRLIRFTSVSGVPHSGSWRLEPVGAEAESLTKVMYRMTFQLPPGIGPIAARMLDVEGRLERQAETSLVNLRRLLATSVAQT